MLLSRGQPLYLIEYCLTIGPLATNLVPQLPSTYQTSNEIHNITPTCNQDEALYYIAAHLDRSCVSRPSPFQPGWEQSSAEIAACRDAKLH